VLTFAPFSNNLGRMRNQILLPMILTLGVAAELPALAELQTGPALPCHVVRDWAQLPAGGNFGGGSAVDVDKSDTVWVFNRWPHPVVEFDRSGKMLQGWREVPVKTTHGLRLDADGNVWTVDAPCLMKWTPSGRLLMMIGDFFVADGYEETGFSALPRAGQRRRCLGR
jgi:hypothetical protein